MPAARAQLLATRLDTEQLAIAAHVPQGPGYTEDLETVKTKNDQQKTNKTENGPRCVANNAPI